MGRIEWLDLPTVKDNLGKDGALFRAFHEIAQWCQENNIKIEAEHFGYVIDDDTKAVLFKLRWC